MCKQCGMVVWLCVNVVTLGAEGERVLDCPFIFLKMLLLHVVIHELGDYMSSSGHGAIRMSIIVLIWLVFQVISNILAHNGYVYQ